MMKRALLGLLLAAQFAVAGGALALTIPVNFNLVNGTVDITNPNPPVLIGDVGIGYDEQGAGTTAFVSDSTGTYGAGIHGGTGIIAPGPPPVELNAAVQLNFVTAPILPYILHLGFILDGPAMTDPIGLAAYFTLQNNYVAYLELPVTLNTPTTYDFPVGVFDYVTLYFTADASLFHITDLAYDPVPEPSTMVLLASGLLGLGVLRFARRKA